MVKNLALIYTRMQRLEASEQVSHLAGEDIHLAFEQNPRPVVYDLSGAVFQSWEAIHEHLGEQRDYTTIIQDEKGNVVRRVEKDERIFWPCKACLKNFTTKQSLERHHERNTVCKTWNAGSDELPAGVGNVYQWACETIDKALSSDKDSMTCRFCSTKFSSAGNLHKHFSSSVACNRLAYVAIKKAFQ